MTMMRRYMLDERNRVVLVQKAEYNFDRYLLWAGLALDDREFIVIDGTLNTNVFDNRR